MPTFTRCITVLFAAAAVLLLAVPASAQGQTKAPDPAAPTTPATLPAPASTPADPKEPQLEKPSHPYPFLELQQKTAAWKVIGTANHFGKEALCSKCSGAGSVDVETLHYPDHTNVLMKEPTKTHHRDPCNKCGGTGLSKDTSFQRSADDLVRDVTGMNPADPRADEARQKVAEYVQAAMKGKEEAAAKLFNPIAQRRTNDQPLKPGTPVIMLGYLMDDPAAVGDGQLIHVGPRRISIEPVALVSNPSMVKAAKGERVIIGGLLAGRQPTRRNETAPVLQGGFVIVLP